MKAKQWLVLGTLGMLACGCNQNKKDEPVVSERYIHKYGYALTKEDWDNGNYPGQVITTLRNGVTITSTYENGVLHGASTHTFSNSHTVQTYFLYNQGEKVKEIQYDLQGMPLCETLQVSPTRVTKTLWYADGTPLSIEEYSQDELLDGQYFTKNNETESRVEKGNGIRICYDREGILLSKDEFKGGYMVKRESFYPNNIPESIVHFKRGGLHGERKTFTASGEPLATEDWIDGQLHGKCTYFKNGTKDYEISYLKGKKQGSEIHYLDGTAVLKEVIWENDKQHGPSTYFIDGIAQTTWYYDGKEVSYKEYQDQIKLDEMVSQISTEYHWNNN